MPLDNYVSVFLVGTVGGVLLEFLHWWNIRKTSDAEFKKYRSKPAYWLLTFGMALCGGLLALFYFGNHTQAMLALHVRLSAPLILQKLTTTLAQAGSRAGNEASVVSFFTW